MALSYITDYCGKTSSTVKDSKYFMQKIKHLSINPEVDTLVPFDVSVLFTSIPVPVHYKLSIPAASAASIRNSIHNYRVQPWVHLSPLSLQISTWNTLNP